MRMPRVEGTIMILGIYKRRESVTIPLEASAVYDSSICGKWPMKMSIDGGRRANVKVPTYDLFIRRERIT